MKIEDYKCDKAPATLFYIPNFISEVEEKFLINFINNAPKPKWTQLAHRRLQNWGGLPHAKGMIAEAMPHWLTPHIDKVSSLGIFEPEKLPNHVLINEYLPGQGIMPHTDGPLFHPIVTTITCGSHCVLDFYRPRTDDDVEQDIRTPCVSLFLERRSLVIVQHDMYEQYLHGIDERTSDKFGKFANQALLATSYQEGETLERGTRLSLTIRHVPKTRTIPGGLFNLLAVHKNTS